MPKGQSQSQKSSNSKDPEPDPRPQAGPAAAGEKMKPKAVYPAIQFDNFALLNPKAKELTNLQKWDGPMWTVRTIWSESLSLLFESMKELPKEKVIVELRKLINPFGDNISTTKKSPLLVIKLAELNVGNRSPFVGTHRARTISRTSRPLKPAGNDLFLRMSGSLAEFLNPGLRRNHILVIVGGSYDDNTPNTIHFESTVTTESTTIEGKISEETKLLFRPVNIFHFIPTDSRPRVEGRPYGVAVDPNAFRLEYQEIGSLRSLTTTEIEPWFGEKEEVAVKVEKKDKMSWNLKNLPQISDSLPETIDERRSQLMELGHLWLHRRDISNGVYKDIEMGETDEVALTGFQLEVEMAEDEVVLITEFEEEI